MELAPDYFHCFLGNGIDAVLVGYTGSMVPDSFGLERCYWYKSDRYYPEANLVKVVDSRDAADAPLVRGDAGWCEIAPLGRTWYELLDERGEPLPLLSSSQRFVPREGTLYTSLDFGTVRGEAVTWLHATRSILVERYAFDRVVEFRAWMGAGVWVSEGWDTDPFDRVEVSTAGPEISYDLGATRGVITMHIEPRAHDTGVAGRERWQTVRASTITRYFSITDDRQPEEPDRTPGTTIEAGDDALRLEHLRAWSDHAATSSVRIPDTQLQDLYESSAYQFKAAQNRVSGGIPVSNLRRPWSSHVFWDAYFIHRAALRANHRSEALEGARFFQRTLPQARRHAAEDFGSDGLKWDWEITHEGLPAYGSLRHQREQVHNNGSYSNLIIGYYDQTRDEDYLAEFLPLLRGLATFFLHRIVQRHGDVVEVGYLTGIDESPIPTRNDATDLAAAIAILRNCVRAARELGLEDAFTTECADAADGLTRTLDRLFNGRYFQAAEDRDLLHMGSLAPIFPLAVVDPLDLRAIRTVDAFLEMYEGRGLGTGLGIGTAALSSWAAGSIATILARQGRGDPAWRALESTRPAISQFGGMAEIVRDGHWNMQYFATAQGAVCGAIQDLLVQGSAARIELFPALPSAWATAGFERLLVSGFLVTAARTPTTVDWEVRNAAGRPLATHVRFGAETAQLDLKPGEVARGTWAVPTDMEAASTVAAD